MQGLAEASTSALAGKVVRPLVLWSSGCKDYGTTKLHGSLDLKAHTETSPLNPPELVRGRMEGALRALEVARKDEGRAGFDVAIVRATPLFGYSGSYYGAMLEYVAAFVAAVAAENNIGDTAGTGKGDERVVKFTADAGTILHGIHVDDCADGYVALARTALFEVDDANHTYDRKAQKARRDAVAGQDFNISGRRYETLEEVGAGAGG